MTIDLSPEELALCAVALRAREAELDRYARNSRGSSTPATIAIVAEWMQEAHAAGLLAARIEDAIAHQDAPTYGPAMDLCPHCRQPLHVHSCVDFACPQIRTAERSAK